MSELFTREVANDYLKVGATKCATLNPTDPAMKDYFTGAPYYDSVNRARGLLKSLPPDKMTELDKNKVQEDYLR